MLDRNFNLQTEQLEMDESEGKRATVVLFSVSLIGN